MSLLADLHRRGHTLVLVTHDPAIAARADRELRLEHGRLAPPPHGEAAPDRLLADLWRALEEEGARVLDARAAAWRSCWPRGCSAAADGAGSPSPTGRAPGGPRRRAAGAAGRGAARPHPRPLHAECGRETPLAPGWEDQVAEFLGRPELCPHGRPIGEVARREGG